ncbi:MAG: bile acid:sodium symporter family protein [Myxococcales bacterium]
MSAKLRIDPYLLALFGCVLLASLVPARGRVGTALDYVTDGVIALLFFLYGTRLSPREAWEGARHLRLQGTVLAFTFVLFPVLGLILRALLPGLLSEELYVGFLVLCALPSTVQSSIAFTSIARGNVAAALTAASLSNLLGVVVTPMLLALMLRRAGTTMSGEAIPKLAMQLLLPFFLGQLSRPWLSAWVTRHKQALGYVDRGSILLVVYSAFSEGVVAGVWQRISLAQLGRLLALDAVLLALVLILTTAISRALRFRKEDEIAAVFCGSKKSLASGLPMASVLFSQASVGLLVVPLMLFHQLQLMACAWLSQRYARRHAAPS